VSSRERVESVAAAWIARRESSQWSETDQFELDEWIASSTGNRAAWLRLSCAWQETQRLKTLYHDAPPGTVPRADEVRLRFFLSAAAILLIFVAAAAWKLLPSSAAYETEVGAVEAVPLLDGSRVTLNTNTCIVVDLTQAERSVNLTRGEAYFEVAKDPRRPFVVRVGDERVIAVGTRFSVRRDPDGVRVFVTEGTVRVEEGSAGQQPYAVAQLRPGSIAHAVADGVVFQTRSVADVEQLLTWRAGYLVFDHTPLAEAVAEFNRYNRRQIVIADSQVATIRIGGNFRATNVEAFLRLVESDFPIVSSVQGGRIILTGIPRESRQE
jgi:transmembrane sensor